MINKLLEEGKKLKLTVFLIKDAYKDLSEFLEHKGGFESLEIKDGDNEIGHLIYKGGFKSEPAWVSIFEEDLGSDKKKLFNISTKALFITKHENRFFCFTFGHSRHLINELAYERNFGLIVTLNLGDPSSIRSIDKTNIGHISLNSKEQTTREIEFSGFEFNNEIDLLKSITAKSKKIIDEEQETYSGRDSVTVYTRVTIETFKDITKKLYTAYKSKKYLSVYPWIEKIKQERDTQIIEQLDNALIKGIFNKDFQKIWLAIPEVIPWEDIKGFAYKYRKDNDLKKHGPVLSQDLNIEEWINIAKLNENTNINYLKNKRIWVYWEDGHETKWSIYRCLNAEIDLNHSKYILNDGDWYNLDNSYVKEIIDYYESIPNSKLTLPKYDALTEPKYLKKVAKNDPNMALMDRKNIMIGGSHSRIEFCDLYSKNKDIIHVKKYGGSSVLSHLFFQAVVSGECFLYEEEFRKELNKKLPNSFKLSDIKTPPESSKYNVCIAIMSEKPGDLELPFFSKVSIKHAVRALQNMGYKVSKLKIER